MCLNIGLGASPSLFRFIRLKLQICYDWVYTDVLTCIVCGKFELLILNIDFENNTPIKLEMSICIFGNCVYQLP